MTRKPFRLAAAAVSGLAITTLAFGAPAAFADTGDQTKVDGVSQAAGNPSLVNPTATVQLNIEKHLGATTGQSNNGTVQSVTTPKPRLRSTGFGSPGPRTSQAGISPAEPR